ncbi:MAG: exodeoxyribonuclease VII large subunit, partial [Gammaproteobacteria bacterium]|nr:exodeoxyribonuclease VII large subunit [Gammaproteobacteria bacterium]
LARSGQRVLENRGQTLDWLSRRLLQTSPQQTLLRQHERLRELRRRLASGITQDLLRQQPVLTNLWQRLRAGAGRSVADSSHRLELAMRGLHAVSPLATLDRGYAIVEDVKSGKVLMNAADAAAGDDIRARLAKGELIATVKSKSG